MMEFSIAQTMNQILSVLMQAETELRWKGLQYVKSIRAKMIGAIEY